MPDPTEPLALEMLVLASASPTRAQMLRSAGLSIETVASGVDEPAVVESLMYPLPPADIAELLATAKAQDVAARYPSRLVLGCDQTLELDRTLFAKPADMDEARRNLLAMRGKTHALHSAAVLVCDGTVLWSHSATAWLTMRDFSPEFLGRYLSLAGKDILGSVGCYRLEGPGVQLFEKIEGDWFTILGLPLLPLLQELRRRGAIFR